MIQFWAKIKKMTIKDYISLVKIIITFIPGKIYKIFNPDIWLISERENEARDNGYWLFKFIRINYPHKKTYYPINFKSADYYKIESLGNIIKFGSLKHHLLFWACNKNISAHIGNGMPNGHICFNLLLYNIYNFKNIFLQHGITCNNAFFLYKKNNKIDLFITAAKREREFIITKFGYSLNDTVLSGFCRFDNLIDNSKKYKQILVLPTWRYWLDFSHNKDVNNSDQIFADSDYYKKYSELLSNEKLKEFCRLNDFKIIFYLHPDLQVYRHLFKENPYIIIADYEKYDIQSLLRNSNFLITDYSSISFDFAYLKKPLVYYQFDAEQYRKEQYEEGYFSYEKDGFGPVLTSCNQVVEFISEIYNSDYEQFNNRKLYLERVENFFEFFDQKNTSRVYAAIEQL